MQTGGTMMGEVLFVTLGRKDLTVKGPERYKFVTSLAPNHKFFFQSLENGLAFMNAEFAFLPSEHVATMNVLLSTPLVLMGEHQHFIGEQPQLVHYHFRGRGAAIDIATWAMAVVHATGTPLPQPSQQWITPLPADELGKIVGGQTLVQADDAVLVSVAPTTHYWARGSIRPCGSRTAKAFRSTACTINSEIESCCSSPTISRPANRGPWPAPCATC